MDQLALQIAELAAQIAALVWWMKFFAGLCVALVFIMFAVLHRLVRVERWQTDHGGPIERLGHEQEAMDAAQAFARRRPHQSGTTDQPH